MVRLEAKLTDPRWTRLLSALNSRVSIEYGQYRYQDMILSHMLRLAALTATYQLT